jgi:PleD family two-component response regulator
MTKIMRRLAGGEVEVVVPSLNRKDEIGDMAKAIVVFKEHAVQNRDQAARERAAEADARHRLEREVAERTRDLKRLAMLDALTGLANRRRLLERIDTEVSRSQESGDNLAILYIDVDRFKHINDTYGHAAGDAALVEVAQILKESLRRTDFVGRLGGRIRRRVDRHDRSRRLSSCRDHPKQDRATPKSRTSNFSHGQHRDIRISAE